MHVLVPAARWATAPYRLGDLPGRRSGIALVIVLGFLAVLVVLAVAFSVSMRVERLASRNYADVVRCRHLLHAALARACDDIDAEAGNRAYPDWGGRWGGGVFPSGGGGAAVRLATGYATNFVPGYILADARGTDARYIDIVDGGVAVGSIAYLALDCSGLIDVNRAYDDVNTVLPRKFGATVNEMQLTNALTREVTRNWENLFRNKSAQIGGNPPYRRMETLPEIYSLGAFGFGNQQPLDADVGVLNLFHYSRYPRGWWDGAQVQQPLEIAGDAGKLQMMQGQIQTELGRMGVPGLDALNTTLNLLDYVDPDNQPRDRASFCTEPVPMINEVVVHNRFQANSLGQVYSNAYRIEFELFYPFGGPPNRNSYTLRVAAQYDGAQPATLNPPPIAGAQGTITVAPPGGSWTAGTYQVVSLPSGTSGDGWLSRSATNVTPNMGNARVRLRAALLESSAEVDVLGDTAANVMEIPIGRAITGRGTFQLGMAVNDPRLNWDGRDGGGQWTLMAPGANTMSNFNTGVSNPGAAGADGSFLMYVANKPLESVGELGFLMYDAKQPWTTLRLLNPNAAPVLDRFTIATNEIQHGLVNLNSRNPMAVATVFNQMRYEHYPDEKTNQHVTATEASNLAYRAILAMPIGQNLSDIENMVDGGINASIVKPLDGMEKESLVRNSAGLFGVRQNLYTILLVAQAYSDSRQVVSEQRAVAVVWRDPYPKEDGAHDMFVRYLRWLTE